MTDAYEEAEKKGGEGLKEVEREVRKIDERISDLEDRVEEGGGKKG